MPCAVCQIWGSHVDADEDSSILRSYSAATGTFTVRFKQSGPFLLDWFTLQTWGMTLKRYVGNYLLAIAM